MSFHATIHKHFIANPEIFKNLSKNSDLVKGIDDYSCQTENQKPNFDYLFAACKNEPEKKVLGELFNHLNTDEPGAISEIKNMLFAKEKKYNSRFFNDKATRQTATSEACSYNISKDKISSELAKVKEAIDKSKNHAAIFIRCLENRIDKLEDENKQEASRLLLLAIDLFNLEMRGNLVNNHLDIDNINKIISQIAIKLQVPEDKMNRFKIKLLNSLLAINFRKNNWESLKFALIKLPGAILSFIIGGIIGGAAAPFLVIPCICLMAYHFLKIGFSRGYAQFEAQENFYEFLWSKVGLYATAVTVMAVIVGVSCIVPVKVIIPLIITTLAAQVAGALAGGWITTSIFCNLVNCEDPINSRTATANLCSRELKEKINFSPAELPPLDKLIDLNSILTPDAYNHFVRELINGIFHYKIPLRSAF